MPLSWYRKARAWSGVTSARPESRTPTATAGSAVAFDRMVAAAYGAMAVQALEAGESGLMTARRDGTYVTLPVDTCIAGEKRVDVAQLNGPTAYRPTPLNPACRRDDLEQCRKATYGRRPVENARQDGAVHNPTAQMSRFRWTIILLLFLINTINYIDRSAIAFAAHVIQGEFGLSSSQLGLVLGAFGIGYLLTTFPGGYVADRIGARITFAAAVVLWSIAIGWTGLATGFVMLYAARIMLGLAEGPSFPAHSRIVERWLPPQERATAVAVALLAIPLALAVGAPLATFLISAFGWRVMFFILAAAGVAWLPAWLYLCRDRPEQSRFVNDAERAHIAQSRARDAAPPGVAGLSRADWRIILTTPTLLAGYWSYFVFGYLLFFVMTWLPEFLRTTYHLDLKQIGWAAALPWAAAAVALYAVGRWSDRLLAQTGRLRIARSYVMAGLHALLAVAVLPLAVIDSLPVALACMSLAVAAGFGANPVFYAVIADVVPRSAGTCMGVMNSGLALAGFLAPVCHRLRARGDGQLHRGLLVDCALRRFVRPWAVDLAPPGPRHRAVEGAFGTDELIASGARWPPVGPPAPLSRIEAPRPQACMEPIDRRNAVEDGEAELVGNIRREWARLAHSETIAPQLGMRGAESARRLKHLVAQRFEGDRTVTVTDPSDERGVLGHAHDRGRRIHIDRFETGAVQRLCIIGHDAAPLLSREQPFDRRDLWQARGRDGHAAEIRQFLLIDRKKAAGRGDPVDPGLEQLLCCPFERVQQARIVQLRHLRRNRIVHDLVGHRKIPGQRIALRLPESRL